MQAYKFMNTEDSRLSINCVARYIAPENKIICGMPDKNWLSIADIVPNDIRMFNETLGRCKACHSYKIAKYRQIGWHHNAISINDAS